MSWRDWFRLRRPQAGDEVWWHSRGFMLRDVDGVRPNRSVFEGYGYTVQCITGDLRWNARYEFWTLPGTEDEMPKLVRGVRISPLGASCPDCGFRTLRPVSCSLCRERRSLKQHLEAGTLQAADIESAIKRINAQQARRDAWLAQR